MTNEKHLGWSNRPTWAAFNWITVDEQMEAAAHEAARQGPKALAVLCREAWLGDVRGPGFASESVEWCLDLIDWRELAAELTGGGKR